MYDSKSCFNSTYWDNFRTIQVVLVFFGILVLVSALVIGIIYLCKRKNKKIAKKLLISFLITLCGSIIFIVSGRLLGNYINSETKDLGYCWASN